MGWTTLMKTKLNLMKIFLRKAKWEHNLFTEKNKNLSVLVTDDMMLLYG